MPSHVVARELRRTIRSDEEGRYLEVPFEVPEDAERIDVSYEYAGWGEGPCTIDLGLRDSRQVRGWSGGARSAFSVSGESATPGYRPGSMEAGTWAVLLGAYRVPPAGCDVRIRVAVTRAHWRWLKGELHSHTVHSDGSYTLEEAVRIVKDAGCDFLATTDHNTVSQNFAHPSDAGITLIPGMELTHSMGHANLLGVRDPIADFRVASREELDDRMEEAGRNGALRVLNHPFCPDCPWLWGLDAAHEAVEIWNGPWRGLNQTALDWWQAQLAAGRRVAAVCGSDVHRPHPYVRHACPAAYVKARMAAVSGILEGISSGRVVMSYAPHGPFADMESGPYGIGDTVPAGEAGEPVRIRFERLQRGDRVRLVTEQGVVREWMLESGREDWAASWPATGLRFIRAEAWRHFAETGTFLPILLTNPIYFVGSSGGQGE